METPSDYLPNLYSSQRDDFYFFPISSRLIDIQNLRFYYKEYQLCEPVLKLFLENNDSLIWQTKSIKDFDNKNINLTKGKNYHWKLYNGSNSLKGEISYLNNSLSKKISKKQLTTKNDYLEKYFLLLENKCYFDAIALLNKAIQKYPESNILKKMKTVLKI